MLKHKDSIRKVFHSLLCHTVPFLLLCIHHASQKTFSVKVECVHVFLLPSTAGEVEVTATTLNIVEGNMDMFCVELTATAGSPNILAKSLTVTFSTVESGKAGIIYRIFEF